MNQILPIFLTLIGAYLLGSLPFGYWVALKVKGVDIRTVGSGNIGSTNVSRICGPVAGGIVWVLDVLKGLIPPLLVTHFGTPAKAVVSYSLDYGGVSGNFDTHFGITSMVAVLAALGAILGHNYSLFLGFKGGKGISTSLGGLLGCAPPVGVAVGLVWAAFVLTLRYISVGSIAAALTLPVFMLVFYPHDAPRLIFAILACFMAVYKHRANIQRLHEGREPKIRLPWNKNDPLTSTTEAETEAENDTIKKESPINASR